MTHDDVRLVANRGEIARRVFRTCRDLGIETGRGALRRRRGPAVRRARPTSRCRLPGDARRRRPTCAADLIVAGRARRPAPTPCTRATASSPRTPTSRVQVIDAGLTWVGPDPESIEAMGSKVEAKKLMAEAGVPVLPELTPSRVTEADLPLLVKASAGGGGRGMRVVRRAGATWPTRSAGPRPRRRRRSATARCSSSPTSSTAGTSRCRSSATRTGTGVGARRPRLLGAASAPEGRRGGACPRARRRDARHAMHDAARAAAQAIGYVGAGTVEFLLDAGDRPVLLPGDEHPAAGRAPGHRVRHRARPRRAQVAVAEGRTRDAIRARAARPTARGHAVEVRLYAEDPAAGWQPQSGRLTRFEVPRRQRVELAGRRPRRPARRGLRGRRRGRHPLRRDAGQGDRAGRRTGPRRCAVLAGALRRARIHGVAHQPRPARRGAAAPRRSSTGSCPPTSSSSATWHALGPTASTREAMARLRAVRRRGRLAERAAGRRAVQRGIPVGLAQRRLAAAAHASSSVRRSDELVVADWYRRARRLPCPRRPARGRRRADPCGGLTSTAVHRRVVDVHVHDADREVIASTCEPAGHVALRRLPRFVDPADQVASGSLLAPMPGSVVACTSSPARPVTAGDPVLVLEAMKMQHTITAPHDGVVTDLPVAGRARRWRPATCWPSCDQLSQRRTTRMSDADHDRVHRDRGAASRCAARWPSWPAATAASTSPRRPAAAARPPSCGGDRQARLPRRHHPRGVRRRWRRHRRPRRGAARSSRPRAARC